MADDLLEAAKTGNLDELRNLLNSGADIDVRGRSRLVRSNVGISLGAGARRQGTS